MWKWSLTACGVNLLLGVPAVVPIWLMWYFAVNWPLAALGWAQQEPTENDGVVPWLLIGVPVVALFVLGWWLANRPVRRGTALGSGPYWAISASATMVPSLALVLIL